MFISLPHLVPLLAFLDVVATALMVPSLPLRAGDLAAGPAATVFLLARFDAAFALGRLCGSLFWGRLVDKLGARAIVGLCSVVGAADYALLASINDTSWLAAGRLVGGFCAVIPMLAFSSAASLPGELRTTTVSRIGTGIGLALVIGPALGGVLVTNSLRLPFYVAALITLAVGAVGTWGFASHAQGEDASAHISAKVHWKGFAGIFGAKLLADTAHRVLPAVMVVYATQQLRLPSTQLGLMFGMMGLVFVLSQVATPHLVRRFREYGSSAMGMLGAALALVAWSSSDLGIFRLGFFLYPALLIGTTTLQMAAGALTPQGGHGRVQGAMIGLQALADLMGPFLFAALFDDALSRGRPSIVFMEAAFLCVIAAVVVWLCRPQGVSETSDGL